MKNKMFCMKRIHYGWVICFACTLMLFVTIGMVANNFTVFMPFVKENYGFTHTQTSSLVTIRCMISFLSMRFTGLYYEKVDIRVGTALAVLFAGIGYMIFSISTTYEMFCVGTAISGMGYGLGSMIPVSILIEHWFIAHKALALSICATGSGIAMIILPQMTTRLVKSVGLALAFRIEGICIFMAATIIFLIIRTSPEKMGLYPLGYQEVHICIKGERDKVTDTTSEFSNVMGMTLLIGSFLMGVVANTGYAHLSVLFTNEGYNSIYIATLLSAIGLILTGSKIFFGYIVDRIGGFVASIIFGTIFIIGHIFCCFVYVHSNMICILLTLTMGIGYAITTLGPSIWAGDMASKNFYAKVIRKLQISYQAGALIFSTVPGILADLLGSYIPAYILFVVFMTISMIMVTVSYCYKNKEVKFNKYINDKI